MSIKHWEISGNIESRRNTMLRFVWFVIGVVISTSYLLPLIGGLPFPLSPAGYSLILIYLITCFLLSLWQYTSRLAPHLMLTGMTFLLTFLCMKRLGVNTPISHFLPLIPALSSSLLRSKYCPLYGLLVSISIVLAVSLNIDGSYRNPSAYDIQNASTLFLATMIITGGSYFACLYEERLARSIVGKTGMDPLTNIPNRYTFIKQYNELMSRPSESGDHLILINFGIDGFVDLNNSQGQQAGDSVLICVARTLASITDKKSDLVISRNQGNSFVLCLLDKSEAYAESLAEEALNLFETLKMPNLAGNVISLSASILMISKDSKNLAAYDALDKSQYHLSMIQSLGEKTIEVFQEN